MVARGDLRDHAAIDCVQVDLAMQGVRQQALLGAEQRHAGLVAAGFYAKNIHTASGHTHSSAWPIPTPAAGIRALTPILCKAPNPALLYAAQSRPCAGFIYVWTEYLNNAKCSRKRERVF